MLEYQQYDRKVKQKSCRIVIQELKTLPERLISYPRQYFNKPGNNR